MCRENALVGKGRRENVDIFWQPVEKWLLTLDS